MTYDPYEASVKSGRPYFLYLFASPTEEWSWTSEPIEMVRGSFLWTPKTISHSDLESSGNIERQEQNLIFALSDEFARLFLKPVSRTTVLTIFRGHHGDVDEQIVPVWKGRIIGSVSGKQSITMKCESIFTSMRHTGCYIRIQRQCAHTLYDEGCTMDPEDFFVDATVTAMTGLNLTIAEAALQANGYYLGGIVDFGGFYGFVENHVGSVLTLAGEISGLSEYFDAFASAPVRIAPGCDYSSPTCSTRFNNIINRLGYDWLPKLNPFTTSLE